MAKKTKTTTTTAAPVPTYGRDKKPLAAKVGDEVNTLNGGPRVRLQAFGQDDHGDWMWTGTDVATGATVWGRVDEIEMPWLARA